MYSQELMHFTPYDDIEGIPKSHKPSYRESMPEWAKLLYQYPISYQTMKSGFDAYMLKTKNDLAYQMAIGK
jgi:hypothetical protein